MDNTSYVNGIICCSSPLGNNNPEREQRATAYCSYEGKWKRVGIVIYSHNPVPSSTSKTRYYRRDDLFFFGGIRTGQRVKQGQVEICLRHALKTK